MQADSKTRTALKVIRYMSQCEYKKGFSGVRESDLIKKYSMPEQQMENVIAALKRKGLIMKVGFEEDVFILSRPAEYITIVDICSIFNPSQV